jgi:hypothetical protein
VPENLLAKLTLSAVTKALAWPPARTNETKPNRDEMKFAKTIGRYDRHLLCTEAAKRKNSGSFAKQFVSSWQSVFVLL